ncbi:SUMF1/EgtB/PvdO family nonheme iron enzyme, partial [Pseudomonadota bacterium]
GFPQRRNGSMRPLEDTKRALGQRQQEIERVLSEQQNLDDTLEDRSAQLEKLTQELEQAKAELQELDTKYREAEEERLQAETALTVMHEREEQGVAASSQPEQAPVQQAVDGGFSKKSGVMGMAAGVLMGVLILDAFMILSGRGEIITGMMGGDEPRTVVITSAPEMKQEPQSPVVSAEPVPPETGPAVEPEAIAKAPVKKAASKKSEGFSSAIGRELQERLASGGVGPKMVRLPAGKFEMGSSRSLIASDERPAHEVSLGSFYMGRYEVTFAEYDRFAKATGRGLPDDKGWGRGKRPVINVSWEDAQAYAQWLSKQSGAVYRLPTEAEWEYAAAGGADSLFWWGYDIGENQANCFNCGGKWAGKQTAPVDSFKPNPYGIHNTAGNAMEWVQDCYHSNYEGAPTDGSAWASFDCKQRVARGGAYSKPGESMRATKRSRQTSASKLPILGFRLVREK